jgi:hypothetical protein
MNDSLQNSYDTHQMMYQGICFQGHSDEIHAKFTAAGKVEREEINQREVGSISTCFSKRVDSKEVKECSNTKVNKNEGDMY